MIDVCILRFHRQRVVLTKKKSKWKEEKGVKVKENVAYTIRRLLQLKFKGHWHFTVRPVEKRKLEEQKKNCLFRSRSLFVKVC